MTLNEILEMRSESDFSTNMNKVEQVLCAEDSDKTTIIEKAIKQHDTLEHEILKREDKIVGPPGAKKTVTTAKLVIPVQKKIVETAVAFLFGTPVKLSLNGYDKSQEEAFRNLLAIWKKNKLDYHNKELARRVFVETRAAELFYVSINPLTKEKRIRTMLLCRENGDEIFPTFDGFGDMVTFTRRYMRKNEAGKEVKCIEMYFADRKVEAEKTADGWSVVVDKNLLGKIPVIYYEQKNPEWSDVQTLIDRQENLLSKNADTNDYFGSPSLKVKGKLEKGPDKNEIGKIFTLQGKQTGDRIDYGDVEYLTWDRTPESIQQEYETLKDVIYSSTNTPDLSFNNVKGTSNLSGIALKFMFLDAVLKSLNKQEIFGEGLDRRINLLKKMMGLLDVGKSKAAEEMEVDVEFQDALPDNLIEIVDMLTAATGGQPIMSKESAVKQNPLVKNPDEEVEKLQEEDRKANSISETLLP